MRRAFVTPFALLLAELAAVTVFAQSEPSTTRVGVELSPLVVRHVVIDASSELLTIRGVGFGRSPVVTLDGEVMPVLYASTTELRVPVPAALKVTHGAYRLTVVDPDRGVGDEFVVTGVAASSGIVAAGLAAPSPAASSVVSDASGMREVAALASGSTGSSAALAGGSADALLEGATNTAVGSAALGALTTGGYNAAVGSSALTTLTSASYNTAVGADALRANAAGTQNTATGYTALRSNAGGSFNTASGSGALYNNTSGDGNTAYGFYGSVTNTSGSYNTTVGFNSLYLNQTGSYNTAVGYGAGQNALGSYNIFLGSATAGASGDSNTIRIGTPFVSGAGQNKTFVVGIRGTTVTGGVPVLVDASHQLGDAPAGPYFTNSGRIGVGTGSPVAALDVVAGTNDGMRFSDGVATGVLFPSGLLGRSIAFGTQSNHPVVFGTNNTFDRLTLAANGNIGIGTTTPVAKLEVSSPTNSGVRFTDGTTVGIFFPSGLVGNSFAIGTQTSHPVVFGTGDTWGRLTIAANGNIGIGTMTPTQRIEVSNGAYLSAGGVWTNASSRALKDEIRVLSARRALEAFDALQPVTFTYKSEPTQTHVGFIAEEVPDLVATVDRKSLSAMDLVALVTKVVQVQREQLAEQERQLTEQDAALAAERAANQAQTALLLEQRALIAELSARLSRLEGASSESAPTTR